MFAVINYDESQTNVYQVTVSFTCLLKCIRMKSHKSGDRICESDNRGCGEYETVVQWRNVKRWRKYSVSIIIRNTHDEDTAIILRNDIFKYYVTYSAEVIDGQLEIFLISRYIPETEIKFYYIIICVLFNIINYRLKNKDNILSKINTFFNIFS